MLRCIVVIVTFGALAGCYMLYSSEDEENIFLLAEDILSQHKNGYSGI